MSILFANNATSRLQIDTPAGSATITLPSGDGARFPITAPGDFFMVTIEDRRTGQMEICQCTARSADVLTVTRGQEGTVAQDFLAGATASNRMTAGTLDILQQAYLKPEADAKFVDAAGDTMTGPLVLPGNPTAGAQASNKTYVDAQVATKANTVHTHAESDVTNLVADLASKEAKAPTTGGFYGRMGAAWVVPTVTEINGLQALLDAKLGEAPLDGGIYGRRNAAWTAIVTDWTSIVGKPSTFPPTLPIAQVDVTNLPADLAAKVGEAPTDGQQYARALASWVVVTGGGGSGGIPEAPTDSQLYGRKNLAWSVVPPPPTWSTLTGKPATFPPTLPIAQSDVTGLTAGQAAQDTAIGNKEPIINPGTSAQFWRGDKTWQPLSSITVDAWTKAEADARFEPIDTMYTKTESDARYVAKAGSTMTGVLVLSADPVNNLEAATKQYADKMVPLAGGTMTGALTLIASVTGGNQATTKNYVDNAIATREPLLPGGGTTSTFLRGDKTWAAVPPAGAKMTCSTTAPSSPADNDLWFNPDVVALYVRYNDGTSTQWVQIG